MTTPRRDPEPDVASSGDGRRAHERAAALLAEGRLGECEAMCAAHLAGEADFARLHYYRGLALHRQRRYAEAERPLRRALELLPDWGRAHFDLAMCLTRLGREDEAWAELVRAESLVLPSQRGMVWTAMAEHLHRAHRAGEALEWAERAIEADGPRPRLARLVGALARRSGALDRSRSVLTAAVSIEPGDPALRAELGWTLALLGDEAEARQHYELADRLEGDAPDPRASWLVSYPKCGVTWLRYMLMQVLAQALGEPLPVESLWLARLAQRREDWPTMRWTHEDAPIISEDGEPVDTHRLWIAGGRARFRRQRVVLLVRDPRDAVVSMYHQATKRSAVPLDAGSLDAFVRDPRLGLDRVLRFYEVWGAAAGEPSSLAMVSYERMLADPVGALERVLEGLGYEPMPRAWLETAAKLGEAGRMRELERRGEVEGMRVFDPGDPDASKVRRARVGTHREEMDAALIAWCRPRLARVPERIARAIWPGGVATEAGAERDAAPSAGR